MKSNNSNFESLPKAQKVGSTLDVEQITWWDKIVDSVSKSKSWMKFLGIVMIIVGALSAITIIGILWAWLYIWLGIILLQASAMANELYSNGSQKVLVEYQRKISTFFQIVGIWTLVSISIAIIFIILAAIIGIQIPDFNNYFY